MAALGWLLNLGFAGGTAVAITVPDAPGFEWTMPENRMHYEPPINRMHYAMPENRIHFTMPEED
ncbi:hypothetical protein LCGC14_0643600 [marine sediment metagenome]|uniref:Uncharacterized protein n=1 Tax=marine sediment metagenome TaxID=412755 RepID=A0A0F9R3N4_9ZZZZ